MKSLRLASIPLIVIPSVWIALLLSSGEIGTDFYPLYFAARRVLAGLSPYGPEATRQLVLQWPAPFATAGIVYPLPFLVLVLPFALLPLAIATAVWILVGVFGAAVSLRLAENWRSLVLLPFLFLPVYRSVALGQATLLWLGLSVLLVLGIQYRWSWAVGVSIALLLLKPQNGLLFAIAGLVWSIRTDPRALLWSACAASCCAIAAMVLEPDWFAAWLAQVQIYNNIVRPPSLLPWGLLLVLVSWRQPWWSIVAACQVVMFPLSDLYSALPLLLCWIGIGGQAALFGAGASWVWSIAGLPNTVNVFWGLIIGPLMMGMLWRSWGEPMLRERWATRKGGSAAR